MLSSTLRVAAALAASCAVAGGAAAAAGAGLYGLSPSVQLLRVYDNGTTSALGAPLTHLDPAQGLAVIDQRNAALLAILFNTSSQQPELVGFDLATGGVVSSTPLSWLGDGYLVGLGQALAMNARNGRVIIAGQLANKSTHVVGQLDRLAGTYKEFARYDDCDFVDGVGGSQAAFDPVLNAVVLQAAPRERPPPPFPDFSAVLLSVSVATGSILRTYGAGGNLQISSTVYDNETGLVFGLGARLNESDPNGWSRTLLRLRTADLAVSEVGVVATPWVTEFGAGAALDAVGRAFYWVGGLNESIHLVKLDLATARVTSTGAAWDSNTYPWAIDYYQGPAGAEEGAASDNPEEAATGATADEFLFARGRMWRAV